MSDLPTRTRFVILALLFVSVVINYLGRAYLSIAGPALAKELAIHSTRMGLVFSAFGWSYVLCQVPGGWLVDRIHPRKLYAVLIALWSLATKLLGLASGAAMLFALRLAIGAPEVPSYPINNRVVTTWFPESERATASVSTLPASLSGWLCSPQRWSTCRFTSAGAAYSYQRG